MLRPPQIGVPLSHVDAASLSGRCVSDSLIKVMFDVQVVQRQSVSCHTSRAAARSTATVLARGPGHATYASGWAVGVRPGGNRCGGSACAFRTCAWGTAGDAHASWPASGAQPASFAGARSTAHDATRAAGLGVRTADVRCSARVEERACATQTSCRWPNRASPRAWRDVVAAAVATPGFPGSLVHVWCGNTCNVHAHRGM